MPDHKYNSIDKTKTQKSRETSLGCSAGTVSHADSTQAFRHATESGSSSVFKQRVITSPTFGPKTKKPRRKQSIYKWLRDRTSGIDIGVEIEDDDGKHPIHLNTNSRVLDHFQELRNEERSFLSRISNMNFIDHVDEVATFYFSGAAEPRKPETLVLIDIDCKEVGSLEGAMDFAGFLRNEHFHNLYIETSTHGKGGHGFFVLDKCGFGDEYINHLLLHRLQPWLRQILREHDFDVENVEIKGTLPVIVWGKERLEVANYRSGTLAKLPRLGTPEKEDALRNTTRLSVYDILKLPVVEKDSETVREAHSGGSIAGSVTGKAISDDELGKIDDHYRLVAESLVETHEMRTAGRTVVTTEDVAIFLLLLRFFSENMNTDGSMPVRRWKKMWQSLFESGDINRAFCPQRFKVIRDHLSSLELLDWQDETYRIGWYDEDGEYHKGKACKWQASERLMGMLLGTAEQDRYQHRGEEASFIRTTLLSELKSIVKLPAKETKQPILIECDANLRLNADEISPFITTFEAFTGLAA